MTKKDRTAKAALAVARAQHDAMELITNAEDPVCWEDETNLHRHALTLAAKIAIENAAEELLDAMLGAPSKGWQNAPEPRDLAKLIGDIEAALPKIHDDYSYLQPGAFTKSKRDTGERTRRSIGGVSGDVGDTLTATDEVRRCISSAAYRVFKARQLILGAEASLNDAVTAIDRKQDKLVDPNPVILDRTSAAEVAVARDMQAKRADRSRELLYDGEIAG